MSRRANRRVVFSSRNVLHELVLYECTNFVLADRNRLQHSGYLLENAIHADGGIDDGIDLVMVRPSMHDENLGSFVRLLDHIGQMMAIFLGHGDAEDDQVKCIAAESFLNGFAVSRGGHVMADFGHFGGLSGERLLVGFAVKNLDGGFRGFLCSGGQGPSCNSFGA